MAVDDPHEITKKNAEASARVEQIKREAREKAERKKKAKQKIIDDARAVGNSKKKGISQS